jgi:hypothetical protein
MSVGGMILASIWLSYRALGVCLCFEGRKNHNLNIHKGAICGLRFFIFRFNGFSLSFVIEMRL